MRLALLLFALAALAGVELPAEWLVGRGLALCARAPARGATSK